MSDGKKTISEQLESPGKSEITSEIIAKKIESIKDKEAQIGTILYSLKEGKDSDRYDEVGEGTSQIDELFRQKFSGVKNIDELKIKIESESKILDFLKELEINIEPVIQKKEIEKNWKNYGEIIKTSLINTWDILNKKLSINNNGISKAEAIIEKLNKINDYKLNKNIEKYFILLENPGENKKQIQKLFDKEFFGTDIGDYLIDFNILQNNGVNKDIIMQSKNIKKSTEEITDFINKLGFEDGDFEDFSDSKKEMIKIIGRSIPQSNLHKIIIIFNTEFKNKKIFEENYDTKNIINNIINNGDFHYIMNFFDLFSELTRESKNSKYNNLSENFKKLSKQLNKAIEEKVINFEVNDYKGQKLYQKIYGTEGSPKISEEDFYKKLDMILDKYIDKNGNIINFSKLKENLNKELNLDNTSYKINSVSDIYEKLLIKKTEEKKTEFQQACENAIPPIPVNIEKINSNLNDEEQVKLFNLIGYYETNKDSKIIDDIIELLSSKDIIEKITTDLNGRNNLINYLITSKQLIKYKQISTIIKKQENELLSKSGTNLGTKEGQKQAEKILEQKSEQIINNSKQISQKLEEKGIIGFREENFEIIDSISDKIINSCLDNDGNIIQEKMNQNIDLYIKTHYIEYLNGDVNKLDLNEMHFGEKYYIKKGVEIIILEAGNNNEVTIKTGENSIKCKPEEVKNIIGDITFFKDFNLDFLVGDMANGVDFKGTILEEISKTTKDIQLNTKNGLNQKEKELILKTFSKIIFGNENTKDNFDEISLYLKSKTKNQIISAMQNKGFMDEGQKINKINIITSIKNITQ